MAQKSPKAANLLAVRLANPFLVLELPPDSPSAAVERKGALLLAMLAVGAAEASEYQTPFGKKKRTPEMVREAMAELRDPQRRLIHEWWVLDEEA